MKTKMHFKKVKNRMTFWFLIAALVPLLVVVGVIYNQRVKSIKKEAFNKLTAIRDLKANEVNTWLEERVGDILTISEDFEIRDLEKTILKTERTQNNSKAIIARKLLARYLENYKEYHEMFIINPISGKIEISTDKSQEGKDKSRDQYFTEPIQTGQIFIKDIYLSKTLNRPSMSFSTPIHCLSRNGEHIIGILVARIDLERSLYALLLNRTGMGETGETLIVNKDVLALNELRWYERAPLKLRIEAEPAVHASREKTGITETADYRGEKVLAAYTYIPKTKWGFVAKEDQKEIYAPIRTMLWNFLILLVISGVVVYWIAVLLAGSISRPIIEMTEVSKRIQRGDLTARNRVQSADELGYLGETFNKMTTSIESQIATIKKVEKDLRMERDTLEVRVQERTASLRIELEERMRVEGVLRESEERFRAMVEGVKDYAIFMLDSGGHIVSWNIGAERIKGYQAEEIVGRHFSCFYPDKDIENKKPQRELDTAIREGQFEEEGWRIRKDGSRFWASVLVTALRDETGYL